MSIQEYIVQVQNMTNGLFLQFKNGLIIEAQVLRETRQVYNLFQDLWNKALVFLERCKKMQKYNCSTDFEIFVIRPVFHIYRQSLVKIAFSQFTPNFIIC